MAITLPNKNLEQENPIFYLPAKVFQRMKT
jgi:hypothetical protein